MTLAELDLALKQVYGGTGRFMCPKCGSSHFGSHLEHGIVQSISCHDEFGRGCRWSGTWDDVPCPRSSNERLAFELADKLIKEGECLTLSYQCGIFRGEPTKMGWYADFRVSESRAAGETRAEAICRAALKVHERKRAKGLV